MPSSEERADYYIKKAAAAEAASMSAKDPTAAKIFNEASREWRRIAAMVSLAEKRSRRIGGIRKANLAPSPKQPDASPVEDSE